MSTADHPEQHSLDEALREREAQYRAVFEAAMDGLVIRDLAGHIVEVNPAYCAMHGYTRAEMIGRPVLDFILPDHGHVLARSAATISAGGVYRGRAVNVRKDGVPFDVEVQATAFTYAGAPHVLAIVRDVTERVRAEAALREREAQYRAIFEATSDGMIVSDRDGYVIEANPAACAMHGFAREEFVGLHGDAFHPPEHRHTYGDYTATVAAGATFQTQGPHLHRRKDGTVFPVEVDGRPFIFDGRQHLLGSVRDITERVQAYELLERRVAERTRELATLLDVSHAIASTLELQPLLGLFLEKLRLVADYSRAAVGVVDGEDLVTIGTRSGANDNEPDTLVGARYPLARIGPIWEVIRRGEPVVLPDLHADGPLERAFREAAGGRYAERFGHLRAWLAVPLLHRERAIGLLAFSSATTGAYTTHQAKLVMAVASQAAVAIENARLYAQAQEAARKTAALTQVTSSVVLGGSLPAALNGVARAAVEASGAVACSLLVGGDDPARALIAGVHGLPDGYTAALESIWRNGVGLLTSTARYFEPGPVVVRDIWRGVLDGAQWAPLHRFRDMVNWDTMVSLALVYGERRQGRLNLYYEAGREPGEAETTFLMAVANQVAIAVENVRLYAEAQGKAALEERQRLARELHDSVSQALYGIALGAATARTLLDRDPLQAAEPLDYVRGLAEAGLAEMRALIFELRPESLADEGLAAALAKQAAAMRARHDLAVEAALGDEPALPLAAKEALYRIAQEALHNVVKHAGARRVMVRLATAADAVVLEVIDDGVGFTADGTFPGHLGLRSMRERAERAGGTLAIESTPGAGATIRARVPHSAV